MKAILCIPVLLIPIILFWSFIEICKNPASAHQYFSALALCSAGIIAFVVFFRDKDKHAKDEKSKIKDDKIRDDRHYDIITIENAKKKSDEDYRHSVFYFNQSFEALDAAFQKIRDGGNTRINWLTAARFIVNAEQLKNEIVSTEIRNAYEIKLHRIRAQFYDFLMAEKIQVPFFLESKNWKEESTEQAIDNYNNNRVKAYSRGKYYVNYYDNQSSRLHPASVEIIFNFAEFKNVALGEKNLSEYEFKCNHDLAKVANNYIEVIEEMNKKFKDRYSKSAEG